MELIGLKDNGIHASAGPIEALRERCIWLGQTMSEDVFTKQLLAAGVKLDMISSMYNNEEITVNETTDKAFDIFEDIDTSETIAMLQEH